MRKILAICFATILLATTVNAQEFCNNLQSWYYNPNDRNEPPTAQEQLNLADFDAYYLGDTRKKDIYLTFDEGYENGYTAPILDVLRDKNVPAAFFVTKTYITANPDLVRRMVDEGHIVGNHTVRHKSSPDLTCDELREELEKTANAYQELINAEMPPFFRPPMGEYSERVLRTTQDCGYSTIFWSFAYVDWNINKQPGRDFALKKVVDNIHNGAILLLHAVSESNAQAMGDIVDALRAMGYEFKSLYDLKEEFGRGIL
ncbi:MAG: delta-lactam-biosynthetic de-N-acetylase [Defluviitaleaceae bacterium]|nr:delta-lactam-biosynthetic de-N-acetylase [Defluviitaleaceae bacterium]